MPEKFEVRHLDIAYDERLIVKDLNIHIPMGKITVLVGANGSGKSTILKAMARLVKPKGGGVFLDGESIHHKSTREVARQLAILPQNPSSPEGMTVYELVSYGRFSSQTGFGSLTPDDRQIIAWAIEVTGIAAFCELPLNQLSGGQRQRAWIAMALAQQTDILFLDEPTTFLDMAHQLEVLQLLYRLNRKEKRTIVMVVHDLNHAARYADHLIAVRQGKVLQQGAPRQVMTPEVLREIFGVEADIFPDPRTGIPLCIPYGLSTMPANF
ncbi:ABC transporter ATP-binding protein [Sporomusa aerivorans]|uniref:ABC transporter ATP-binding protein n=1 Tax=Sporomusa aerivorans TaxID=204936 RepID=UPI00352B7A99